MKYLLVVFTLFCFQFSFSQSVPDFETVRLDKAADYKPAERFVLAAVNYALSTPYNKDDADRQASNRFILKWMQGTPSFGFDLDESVRKIIKGNDGILPLYMAGLAKYVIENPDSSKDQNVIKENALNTVIKYCEDPKNNFKMTKGLRKYADSKMKA